MGIREIVEGRLRSDAFMCENERNKLFPRADWKYEVDNDDTSAGYEHWLTSKIEVECDNAEYNLERLLHAAPRAFFADSSAEECARVVEDAFNDFRATNYDAAIKARGILCINEGTALYGEACKILPDDMLADLDIIATLGMKAYEGGVEQEVIDRAIHVLGQDYGLESGEVELARMRLGIDFNESLTP